MKLTSTRVSILALSVFSALIARELLRSDAKPSSATPPNSTAKRSLFTQPLVPSTPPLAQPETIASSNLPQSIAPLASLPSATEAAKAPQTPLRFPDPVAPIEVNSLPIDQIVAESVGKSVSPPPLPETSQKPAPQAAFQDVQGHRAQNSITALMQRGIMQGFSDGTFRPDAQITDAQFKAVLKKAAEKLPSRLANGIASLKRPSDIVTRADAATYVHRQLLRASVIASEGSAPQSAPLPTLASAPTPVATPMPPTSVSQTPLPPSPNAQPASEMPFSIVASAIGQSAMQSAATNRVKPAIAPEFSQTNPLQNNPTSTAQQPGSIPAMSASQRVAGTVKSRPINVTVIGEVGKPGPYTLTPEKTAPTLTTLIREAGGIKPLANVQNVIVRRLAGDKASQTISVNLWKLLSEGDLTQDVVLQSGDTVEVPTAQTGNATSGLTEKSTSFAPVLGVQGISAGANPTSPSDAPIDSQFLFGS